MSSGDDGLSLTIEFGGGAELLFGKKKKHEVNLPGGEEWTLKRLLYWIRDNLLTEREELFLQDDTVRPGILVLVNDADWELLGIVRRSMGNQTGSMNQINKILSRRSGRWSRGQYRVSASSILLLRRDPEYENWSLQDWSLRVRTNVLLIPILEQRDGTGRQFSKKYTRLGKKRLHVQTYSRTPRCAMD